MKKKKVNPQLTGGWGAQQRLIVRLSVCLCSDKPEIRETERTNSDQNTHTRLKTCASRVL